MVSNILQFQKKRNFVKKLDNVIVTESNSDVAVLILIEAIYDSENDMYYEWDSYNETFSGKSFDD